MRKEIYGWIFSFNWRCAFFVKATDTYFTGGYPGDRGSIPALTRWVRQRPGLPSRAPLSPPAASGGGCKRRLWRTIRWTATGALCPTLPRVPFRGAFEVLAQEAEEIAGLAQLGVEVGKVAFPAGDELVVEHQPEHGLVDLFGE